MGFAVNGRGFVAAATVALIAGSQPAAAASFDCGKAKTADEKAICADRTLSELDVAMATLYGVRMQIPMLMGARGAAQDEQRAWLAQRRACGGDTACLTQIYQQRIVDLDQTITEAMHDYCTRLGICG
jgi:uncharacterized protein